MDSAPHIPGYEIERLLGRGGMAAVYAARQLALGRQVAIKVVAAAAPMSIQQRERLHHEARALAGLHHPNIVELYDFGAAADGSLYYVMPLLSGGDLTAWPRPVPPEQVIDLLLALLDALDHAHQAGIVHRDIKPENILFDRNGRPLLADFGAALQRTRSRLTEEGIAIGSTGYMSPEQSRAAEVDARSDLYSLAVVAFELLTSRLPFDGPDALAVALAQHEQPVPMLPPALTGWQDFFDRALAADPARRHPDARAMREDVLGLRTPVHPTMTSSSVGTRGGRWLAAVALAVVLALVAVWVARDDPAERLDAIAALVARDALLPPQQPNALDELLAADLAEVDPTRLAALRASLLQALAIKLEAALTNGQLQQALPLWRQWQRAVPGLAAEQDAHVLELEQRVAGDLDARLQSALRAGDRAGVAVELAWLEAWTLAPRSTLEWAARVRALPSVGDRQRDAVGIEWMTLRVPRAGQPGLAIMSGPVTPALYTEFARSSGRADSVCAQAPAGVRGCLDLRDAQAFARWLDARVPGRPRLPTRDELATARQQLQVSPALAWTASCAQVSEVIRPNLAQRAVGGVRRLFGGEKAQPRVETRCDGQIALPLDPSGPAEVLHAARADSVLVLVKDLAATP